MMFVLGAGKELMRAYTYTRDLLQLDSRRAPVYLFDIPLERRRMEAVVKRPLGQGVLRLSAQRYDGRIQSGLQLLVVLVRAGQVQYEIGAGEPGGSGRVSEEGGGARACG